MTHKHRIACALMGAALMLAPVMARGAQTVPLITGSKSMEPGVVDLGKVSDYKTYGRYCGVTVSDETLRQARVSGLSIGLRVYNVEGEALRFRERLAAAQDGGVLLMLKMITQEETMTMQFTEHAIEVFDRTGITQLVIADREGDVRAIYSVAELAAARRLLGLHEDEQLCVGRDDEPVTVVGTDGVRRQINP